MPQIHIRLSEGLLKGLDALRWKVQSPSRNALIVSLLALLVPPVQPKFLGRFIFQNCTKDDADRLIAEIIRQQENYGES